MGRPFLILRRAADQAKCCCRRRKRKVISSCIPGEGGGMDRCQAQAFFRFRSWLPYSVDVLMYKKRVSGRQ